MTKGDHTTHEDLAARLRETLQRLRQDLSARSDTTLEELAGALDLVLDLTTHVHEHAVENRARIEAIERAVTPEAG